MLCYSLEISSPSIPMDKLVSQVDRAKVMVDRLSLDETYILVASFL